MARAEKHTITVTSNLPALVRALGLLETSSETLGKLLIFWVPVFLI